MEKTKNILLSLLVPVVEVIIGILLLASPEGLVKGVVVTFGLLLIVSGVMCAIPFFKKDSESSRAKLVFGIILAVCGLIIALCCKAVVALFPAAAVLYGIGLLIGTGVKIPKIVSDIRKGKGWIVEGLGAVVLAVIGILALGNPFGTVNAVFCMIAIGLFMDAAFTLIGRFLIAGAGKQ